MKVTTRRIAMLLATTDITIIPTINPDGFDRGTEGACSGRHILSILCFHPAWLPSDKLSSLSCLDTFWSVSFLVLPGHLLATSWPPPVHLLATSWPPPGHLLATSCSPPGHLLATSWPLPFLMRAITRSFGTE